LKRLAEKLLTLQNARPLSGLSEKGNFYFLKTGKIEKIQE